jgi:hypothetical protein
LRTPAINPRIKSLVLLTAALILLAACAGETPQAVYPAYADAVADGAIERGWIPEWVPASAFDIYEKHDLDTNGQILLFTVPTKGKDWLPGHCQAVNLIRPPTLSATWWPKNIDEMTPDLYLCGNRHLAIHDNQAFMWLP